MHKEIRPSALHFTVLCCNLLWDQKPLYFQVDAKEDELSTSSASLELKSEHNL